MVEERSELGLVHLARGHWEGAVMDRAKPARVTLDRHVVGWVGKHHRGAFLAHQQGEGAGIEGVATQHAMPAKDPYITESADRWPCRDLGQNIGRVGLIRGKRVFQRLDPHIDLAHLKADIFDVKIEIAERQVSQLLSQQAVVPGRIFRQFIIGDRKGAGLGWGQMLEADGWHLLDAGLAASEHPAMSGEHLELGVDQDRDIKTKRFDALSNLLDLFLAVLAWVCRVRLKLGYRAPDDLQIFPISNQSCGIRMHMSIPTIGLRGWTTRRLNAHYMR